MFWSLLVSALVLLLSSLAFRFAKPGGHPRAPTPYDYAPLKSARSIRIFHLAPALPRNSPVVGTLSDVELDTAPYFEALSYVWGTNRTKVSISVDGRDLEVTPNCLDALQGLRYRFKRRLLWVDAICIDQKSTAEKNLQVPMMADIYSRASSVLLWLNDSGARLPSSSQAMSVIKWIGRFYRWGLLRVYDPHTEVDEHQPKDSLIVRHCETEMIRRAKQLGDAFSAPFLHPYFSRVWTVQEIAMATRIRVYHGTAAVEFRDFVAAALFAVREPGGFLKFRQRAADIYADGITQWTLINGLETHFVLPDYVGLAALHQKSNSSILRTLTKGTANLALSKSQALHATEPKDKVYAMLWALAEDTDANRLVRQVDYNKPIATIYTEFAIALLTQLESPTDIFYNINTDHRTPELPSWIPDWQRNVPMTHYLWCQSLRGYRAAGNASLRNRLHVEGSRMQIRGKRLETIRALIALGREARQRDSMSTDTKDLIDDLLDMAALLQGFIDTYHSHGLPTTIPGLEDIILSLIWKGNDDLLKISPTEVELAARLAISTSKLRLRVLTGVLFLVDADRVTNEEIMAALAPFLSYDVMRTILEGPRVPPLVALLVALDPYIGVYQFLTVVANEHRDKDFFISSAGRPGIAFHGLSAGDHIVLWEGCRAPMVAQRIETGGRGIWTLRGPTHVLGIMDGEAWIDDDEDLEVFDVI